MRISKQKNTSISYDIYRGINDDILTSIRKRFKNVEHNINDIISPIKISRYESKVGYIYFALLLPEYDIYENIAWKQTHAFVRDDYILFIDEDAWRWFDVLNANKKITNKDGGLAFFTDFMGNSVSGMFDILAKLQLRIENIEQSIFRNIPNNDQLSEIQNLKKNIINFKSVITPLYEVFEGYIEENGKKIDSYSQRHIRDILRKIKKLRDNLEDFHGITKLLSETNETLIARSTNETIKRLTLFNALLIGPSTIAAFFGMNIHFGWFTENASDGQIAPLLGIMCIMIIMTSSVYLFFRKKNWI